jgi:hypothetical protein
LAVALVVPTPLSPFLRHVTRRVRGEPDIPSRRLRGGPEIPRPRLRGEPKAASSNAGQPHCRGNGSGLGGIDEIFNVERDGFPYAHQSLFLGETPGVASRQSRTRAMERFGSILHLVFFDNHVEYIGFHVARLLFAREGLTAVNLVCIGRLIVLLMEYLEDGTLCPAVHPSKKPMHTKKLVSKTNFAKLDASNGVPDEESPEVSAQDLARATFSIGNVVIRGPCKAPRRAVRAQNN